MDIEKLEAAQAMLNLCLKMKDGMTVAQAILADIRSYEIKIYHKSESGKEVPDSNLRREILRHGLQSIISDYKESIEKLRLSDFDTLENVEPCESVDISCDHPSFNATVDVSRLEDTGRFMSDVEISCAVCGVPMRFIGLPAGLDMNGATVSMDGTEGRFAIAPKGEVVSELEGTPIGFTVRKDEGGTR